MMLHIVFEVVRQKEILSAISRLAQKRNTLLFWSTHVFYIFVSIIFSYTQTQVKASSSEK